MTPSLNRARSALLHEYNVMWVPMDVQSFAAEVVPALEPGITEGQELIGRVADYGTPRKMQIVAEIAAEPDVPGDFLLGAEPTWGDVLHGRAAARDFDEQVWQSAVSLVQDAAAAGLMVLTGTAGSGKSVAAMTLGLRLSAGGHRVGWMDRETSLAPGDIRRTMQSDDAPDVLIIDDADAYGSELATMAAEITGMRGGPLVVAVARSSRIPYALPPARLGDVRRTDHTVPSLTDADIDRLIDLLAQENRLGVLRSQSRANQRTAFRSRADRQLIVAMIEATSGQRFEDKVTGEFGDLPPDSQLVYGVVAVASHFGYSLSRQDLLIGLGDRSNIAVNALDQMIRAGLIIPASHGVDLVRTRHRVIADLLLRELQQLGGLEQVMRVVALIGASHVRPDLRRSDKAWRFLRQVLSHDFLLNTLGSRGAGSVYEEVEGILSWDHHYWLQRGSMELESGRLDRARNFLGQARALDPDDPNVQNEWAYLLYKNALDDPSAVGARQQAEEAQSILRGLIAERGARDNYPYHVYGSQGLAWARRAYQSLQEKQDFLDDHRFSGSATTPRVAQASAAPCRTHPS